MHLTLKRIDAAHFEALTPSGHRVLLDGPAEIGGLDRGARPMEMVLIGLAGCSAVDVLLILQKGRHAVHDLEVEVEANRAHAVPAVFTDIHLIFTGEGTMSKAHLERAVSLSMEKYCSVAQMLAPTVKITHKTQLRKTQNGVQ
jgi:putative redox protein